LLLPSAVAVSLPSISASVDRLKPCLRYRLGSLALSLIRATKPFN
jgi:hypothetical protein